MPPDPQWKAQVSSRASLDGRCLPIRLALPPGWLLGKWLKGHAATWVFSASASPSQGSSGNGVLRLRLLQQQMTNRTGENSLPRSCHWESRGNPPGSGKLDDGEPSRPPPSWPGSCDCRARKSPPRSEPLPDPDSASSTS